MKRREPKPTNGTGYDYIPTPEGKPLTETEIASVGQTIYSRFYQTSRMPDYKDVTADKARSQLEQMVKQVIDSLIIKGFKVLPPTR